MRYFRKLIPATPVQVFGSKLLKFNTNDGQVGYFATPDPAICAEFENHMRNSNFGISEISWEEFNTGYVQKKTGEPLKPPSREEFSGGRSLANLLAQGQDSSAASSAVAVGVAKDTAPGKPVDAPATPPAPKPEVSTIAMPKPSDVKAPEKPEFQPTVGKRKRHRQQPLE